MNKLHAAIHRLHNSDLSILFVRLALGLVFVHAGWLKVTNMEMVASFFGSMGFPVFFAYLVGYVELIGGIAMIVGIFVRYFGILLAIVMLVAMFKVHLPNGYGLSGNGVEYVLSLFLLAAAMVTSGSGKYSLAALIRK